MKRPVKFRMRGFTIMETLLAVTLFALVLSSAYGIFSSGIHIWKRSQGRMRVERKVVLALEKMGREIRTAPMPSKPDQGLFKKEIELGGNSTELILPAIVNFTGVQGDALTQYGSVTYRFDSARRELCRAALSATDLFRGREPECQPLAGSIQRAVFRYWLYTPISKSFSWYDEWDSEDGLPQAIEVTIEIMPQLPGEKSAQRRTTVRRLFVLPGAERIQDETQTL